MHPTGLIKLPHCGIDNRIAGLPALPRFQCGWSAPPSEGLNVETLLPGRRPTFVGSLILGVLLSIAAVVPASASAASRLRVEVVKNSITADSSNEGEFDTSTTTDAP